MPNEAPTTPMPAEARRTGLGAPVMPSLGRVNGADGRVDRQGPTRPRHRDTVVAVAYGVRVAHQADGDRRQDGAAVLGQPKPLPAAAGAAGGTEAAVEQRGPAWLERAADRFQRDLADAASGRARTRQRPLVVDGKPVTSSGLAAQPARERRAPPRARHPGEGPLGVDRA